MTDDRRPELLWGLAAQGRDGALRRSVDQALIRGLGTAFRVFVSGLVLCLEGGRRVQPGPVASDRNSPPWLHPRRTPYCCHVRQGRTTHSEFDFIGSSPAPLPGRGLWRYFIRVVPVSMSTVTSVVASVRLASGRAGSNPATVEHAGELGAGELAAPAFAGVGSGPC
jgi:hypothetical protein